MTDIKQSCSICESYAPNEEGWDYGGCNYDLPDLPIAGDFIWNISVKPTDGTICPCFFSIWGRMSEQFRQKYMNGWTVYFCFGQSSEDKAFVKFGVFDKFVYEVFRIVLWRFSFAILRIDIENAVAVMNDLLSPQPPSGERKP